MTAAGPNQVPPGGKHVTSMAPGGPRDLSVSLARQRAGNDARPTTVGKIPGDPGAAPSRDMTGDPLTSAEPAAYSAGNSFHGGLRDNY